LWKPTDNFSLELLYELKHSGDPTALTFNYLQYQAVKRLNPNEIISTTPFVTSLPVSTLYGDELSTYALKGRWDTSFGYFSNTASYMYDQNHARYNADGGTPAVLNETMYKQHSHAFQEELNLNSNPGKVLDYVLGLYYYDGHEAWKYADILSNAQVFGPANVHFFHDGRPALDDRSFALYADGTWNISEALHLSAGLRYGTEKVTVFNTASGQLSSTFNSLTPRLVGRYQLDEHSNVYASYSQGYKAGTYNFGQPSLLVRPEHLTAYEIGYKAYRSIFSFDADVFYYDYKDLQVTALVPGASGAVLNVTTNAARAKDYGAEFQFSVQPVDRLTLSLAGAYTHARYANYTTFSPALPNPTTGFQAAGIGLAGPQETNLSGQTLTRAPDWSFNANAAYTWLLSKGSLTANANVSWQSQYAPTSPDWALGTTVGSDGLIQPSGHGQRLANPAYALFNGKITWNATDKFSIGVYGNNLGDKKYFATLNSTSSGVYGQWAPPREYGVRLDYAF
jgi:iron complex outermembrane receptor protein